MAAAMSPGALPPEALAAPIRFYVTVTDGDWTDEEVQDVNGVHFVSPEGSTEVTGEFFLEHAIIR